MEIFDDELIGEFMEWKRSNPDTFTWWSFVNLKADLQTALGFAKFFYPDIVEVEGCFLLKDKFSEDLFQGWKEGCKNDKKCIEKMMNLYELRDFFHLNRTDDSQEEEQIVALGDVLTRFWRMSFKDRFPNRTIVVKVFEEYEEGQLFITVYEETPEEETGYDERDS